MMASETGRKASEPAGRPLVPVGRAFEPRIELSRLKSWHLIPKYYSGSLGLTSFNEIEVYISLLVIGLRLSERRDSEPAKKAL